MFRFVILVFILNILSSPSFAGVEDRCSQKPFSFKTQNFQSGYSQFERRTGDQNTGIVESWLIERSSFQLSEYQVIILEKVVSGSLSYKIPYHEKYNKKDIEEFLKEGASTNSLKSDFVCFLKDVLSEVNKHFDSYGY